MKESRFGHSEGITDISATADGKLLTCGSDGDVRMWDGFSDPDPYAFSASDSCLSLFCYGHNVYTATENHTVEAYELPKGSKLGNKAKFTATVNHIDISEDGELLVAGSGDCTVQIVSLGSSSTILKKFEAHSAPVLSVSIDPLKKFFASSGCDGAIKVWSLSLDSKPSRLEKIWDNVFGKSSDISLSPILARLKWTPKNGRCLAIPETSRIVLYNREGFSQARTYQCSDIMKMVSVIKYSDCGKFIAGGCTDGLIVMWNASNSNIILKHTFASNPITGLLIRSSPKVEVYITDCKGRFHYITDVFSENDKSTQNMETSASSSNALTGDEAMFEAESDDNLLGLLDSEDDDNEFSITKIKAEVGFINDEYVGVKNLAKTPAKISDDDRSSILSDDEGVPRIGRATAPYVNPFTEPQESFQPGSSPVHLEHRFMVWNNVGIVRSYSMDDEDAIDIEFHDFSHHQQIHLRNQFDYTMGVLSSTAVVFASGKGTDHPSKLFCINYASWDSKKEWTVDMPDSEEIQALAIGEKWVAVCTSVNRIRLYSLSGIQYFVYDTPGQVVALSGFNNLLFLTYNYGVGVRGHRSIFYSVMIVKCHSMKPLISHEPLPLSPGCLLAWIGFSEEGTPSFSDTSNTVKILHGRLWTPFCDMKEFLSGPSDQFWVVGLSQLAQNVRAVKCKGAKYPPCLPRPTQMILDAKTPLCELDTEKSRLEDIILRSIGIRSVSKKLDTRGFDTEEYRRKGHADLLKSLINLFEISMKGGRDVRASEYMGIMPFTKGIEAGMKLASQLRKNALVERLRTLAQEKMESDGSDEDDDDFENYKFPTAPINSFSQSSVIGSPNLEILGSSMIRLNKSRQNEIPKPSTEIRATNPMLEKQKQEIRNILAHGHAYSNPFKKTHTTEKNDTVAGSDRGLLSAAAGTWKTPHQSQEEVFNPKFDKGKTASKRLKKKTNTSEEKEKLHHQHTKKKQATLFEMRKRGEKPQTTDSSASQSSLEVEGNEINSCTSTSVEPKETDLSDEEQILPITETGNGIGTKRKRLSELKGEKVQDQDSADSTSVFLDGTKDKSEFVSSISKFVRYDPD